MMMCDVTVLIVFPSVAIRCYVLHFIANEPNKDDSMS